MMSCPPLSLKMRRRNFREYSPRLRPPKPRPPSRPPAGARLFQGTMTGAPGRTPTLSKSSGGWVRASGLRVFSAALLPPELHRNEQEILVGVESTSCDFADRRLASRPQDQNRAGGGARTHFVRVTRAVPGPSSIAGIFFEQPVLVSSQLDRGSEPPSPAEG